MSMLTLNIDQLRGMMGAALTSGDVGLTSGVWVYTKRMTDQVKHAEEIPLVTHQARLLERMADYLVDTGNAMYAQSAAEAAFVANDALSNSHYLNMAAKAWGMENADAASSLGVLKKAYAALPGHMAKIDFIAGKDVLHLLSSGEPMSDGAMFLTQEWGAIPDSDHKAAKLQESLKRSGEHYDLMQDVRDMRGRNVESFEKVVRDKAPTAMEAFSAQYSDAEVATAQKAYDQFTTDFDAWAKAQLAARRGTGVLGGGSVGTGGTGKFR